MTYNWQPSQRLPMVPNMNPVPQMSGAGYGPMPMMSYGRMPGPNLMQPVMFQPAMQQQVMTQPAMMHSLQSTMKKSPSNSPVLANDQQQGQEKRKRKESLYVDLTEDDDVIITNQSIAKSSCRFGGNTSPTMAVPSHSNTGQTNQHPMINNGQVLSSQNLKDSLEKLQLDFTDIVTQKNVGVTNMSPYFGLVCRMQQKSDRIYAGVCLIQDHIEGRKIMAVGDMIGAKVNILNQTHYVQWKSVCRVQRSWVMTAMSDILSPDENLCKNFNLCTTDDQDAKRLEKLGPSLYEERHIFKVQYRGQTLIMVLKLTDEPPANYYWTKLGNALKVANLKGQPGQVDFVLKAIPNNGIKSPNNGISTNLTQNQTGISINAQKRVSPEGPFGSPDQAMTNGGVINIGQTQRGTPVGQRQNGLISNHPVMHQALNGINGSVQLQPGRNVMLGPMPNSGSNVVNIGGHPVQVPTMALPATHNGIANRPNHANPSMRTTLPPPFSL